MVAKLNKIVLVWHTVKYLKFRQIYYRVYYKFLKPRVKQFHPPCAAEWVWSGPLCNEQSLFDIDEVIFLNQVGKLNTASDWNSPSKPKLWLYNLHYFDDLTSSNAASRNQLHKGFINKWIDENPPCHGNGWEPYPISLRLVNWTKWLSVQSEPNPKYLASMLQQADVLNQLLEYHILGNHLFANAKALIFTGAYLECVDAEKLLLKGIKILNQELKEQFLDDGAHFELSPMYHSILLWDLLELIDLAKTSGNAELIKNTDEWIFVAQKALSWLSSMIHNDGEVSFFNDSSIGIAVSPKNIFEYSQKLGLHYQKHKLLLLTNQSSGYSRISFPTYSAIFDHANVGPDYLPGHAHADTLSFELSVDKQRVFVNSGTSLYGVSEERLRQRQTPAHNTVSVESYDSSQVWSGFRVAKRAYSQLEHASFKDGVVKIVASHDGYLKQSPKVKHTRALNCFDSQITILDTLSKSVDACFYLHIHPDIHVKTLSSCSLELSLDGVRICTLNSTGNIKLIDTTWHPKFGKSISNKKIKIPFSSGKLQTTINFTAV